MARITDLFGAPGGFIGRVEVEDDGLALELGERHRLAVLVLEGEVGRHAALAHLQASSSRDPQSDSVTKNSAQASAHPRARLLSKLRTYLAADDARGRGAAARCWRDGECRRRRPEAAERRRGGGPAEERLRA